MKPPRFLLLSGLLGLLVAPVLLPAAPLASDNLAGYAVGVPPAGAARGQGWAMQPWSSHAAANVAVREDETGRYIEVSGGNTSRALVRRLAAPAGADGRPVYFRSRFSIASPGDQLDARIFGGWYFVDAAGYRTELNAAVIGPGRTASARLGKAVASLPGPAAVIAPRQPRVLVAKLDGWDAAKSRFTRTTVWLDPDPATGKSGQTNFVSANAGEGGSGPVALLHFRIHNLGESAFRIYDVRLASTWEDAVGD